MMNAPSATRRELACRLYTLCECKKRAAEALSYNGLVQSFPKITRLAREGGTPKSEQAVLFGKEEDSAMRSSKPARTGESS